MVKRLYQDFLMVPEFSGTIAKNNLSSNTKAIIFAFVHTRAKKQLIYKKKIIFQRYEY